jgi:hypothetical protein
MQVIDLLFKPNCFEKTEERGKKKLKIKIAHNSFIREVFPPQIISLYLDKFFHYAQPFGNPELLHKIPKTS